MTLKIEVRTLIDEKVSTDHLQIWIKVAWTCPIRYFEVNALS
jgi:hypothetical protein